MSAWGLPSSLCVGGHEWTIRTDFRAILDILKYFNDPEYEEDEKWEICLDILYEDFAEMPLELWKEAAQKAIEFIDMGIREDGKARPKIMDWEQDAPIIATAVNSVLGGEVRSPRQTHWWTFLGAYMEIGESLFSQVLNIRSKKKKGEKLEKWEQKFYAENKALVDLKTQKSERSEEEKEAIRKVFGIKG